MRRRSWLAYARFRSIAEGHLFMSCWSFDAAASSDFLRKCWESSLDFDGFGLASSSRWWSAEECHPWALVRSRRPHFVFTHSQSYEFITIRSYLLSTETPVDGDENIYIPKGVWSKAAKKTPSSSWIGKIKIEINQSAINCTPSTHLSKVIALPNQLLSKHSQSLIL